MPLPEKEYFVLEEIERRWRTERADTIYYAENGLLAVAVPATALRIEIGQVVATACGEALRVQAEHLRASGPLRLRERDAATVLRRGSAEIIEFWAEEPNYCVLAPAEKPLVVAAQDLVVGRDERDRFEHAHRLGPQQTTPATRRPLADYRFVSPVGGPSSWAQCRRRPFVSCTMRLLPGRHGCTARTCCVESAHIRCV